MKKILLVCTGNTCRSPMAEGMARSLLKQMGLRKYSVASAGIGAFPGDLASSWAVEVMLEEGIDLSRHRARTLSPEMVNQADYIFTMTRQQREIVVRAVPEAEGRVYVLKEIAELGYSAANSGDRWDIPDPVGKPITVYRKVASELKLSLAKVLSFIKEQEGLG